MREYKLSFPAKVKTRMRLKKLAKNPFTKATGLRAFYLSGKEDCLVTHHQTFRDIPVRKIAYAIYNDWQRPECTVSASKMKRLRVTQICGVDQCVHPDHLKGEILPQKLV